MKRVLVLTVVYLLLFLCPKLATAQIAKWADEKYAVFLECLMVNDDYTGAKTELLRLSGQGDSQATCCLAAMLCFGEKQDRDYSAALELLIKSAADNEERAEYLLGSFGSLERSREVMRLIIGDDSLEDEADNSFWSQCFKSSDSEVVTFKDAFKWFFMEDGYWGYKDIMYYCAVQYLNGLYGVVDANKAIKWLIRSRDLGSEEAAELLYQVMEIIFENNNGE